VASIRAEVGNCLETAGIGALPLGNGGPAWPRAGGDARLAGEGFGHSLPELATLVSLYRFGKVSDRMDIAFVSAALKAVGPSTCKMLSGYGQAEASVKGAWPR
jgi:hypothetical protein